MRVVTFGEIMMRLATPGRLRFSQAKELELTYGGGEANVAVSLANYISTVQASTANPFGAILAGAVVLAIPVIVLFVVFQRQFVSTDLGSGVKG